MPSRPYRLGIDVGSNSLGWFVVWLNGQGEPVELGPGGVRIYPDGRDPKSKESNAADRRVARGMRRRRDRYLQRRGNLMGLLIKHGLMPADERERKALEKLDPYELRARALDQTMPAYHIGRALFHLNQRRGFLSNRKTEKGDTESGAIKQAAAKLAELKAASGARTLGELLAGRHQVHAPVRTRNTGTGTKVEYDFYPTRQLLLEEFDAIWVRQASHHPAMTQAARDAIHKVIFHQRPLKQPPVGKCSLDPATDKDDLDGFRCPWAHPLAQRFRIWQEVRNLAIVKTGKISTALSQEDQNKVALALIQNSKLSFDKIRGVLKLSPEARFNLESEKRKEMLGDETAAKLSHKSLFGKAWRSFDLNRQIEIVNRLLDDADEKALISWLVANTGVEEETADRIASAFLPDSHSRLGLRAIRKILPHMEIGMTKTQAEDAAGYKGVHNPDGELSLDGYLPYYGEWLQDDVLGTGDPRDGNDKRWGRFPNPTVHIGLGQIRRVVNALIAEYGAPAQIALEMTHDFKLSPTKLAEVEKIQAENQVKNEKRAEEIRKLGQAVNSRNLMKMRLWEELNPYDVLDRQCPYTGTKINIATLLSDDVDIDHLIPFADSLDDSAANKIVCMRQANRDKGKQTPFEAFGHRNGSPYDWNAISQRAAAMKGKAWRFGPDARHRFDLQGGFQARQLNETGWLARVALHYLAAVTDSRKIHVLPGKLTAMIRAKWGLNTLLPDHNFSDAKNRKDHRHHAIDALVAAMTDRSLMHRMSSAYDDERQKIEIPPPWPTLRDDLDARLKAMTVSYKPDHGGSGNGSTSGALHEDTAYGIVKHPEKEGGANLVRRKNFLGLSHKEIPLIRDIRLRELVTAHVATEQSSGKDLKAALQSFTERKDITGLVQPIRHVRLTKTEKPEYLVPVQDKSGKTYKAYSAGENACVDIFEMPDGKWGGEAMSVFKANQNSTTPNWQKSVARFVMRVFKGDLIGLDLDGKRTVMVVHRLDASAGRFKLAAHNETGNLDQRHADEADPFRWLMASYNTLRTMNAERVRVDELGRLWRVKPDEALRGL